MKGAIRLDILVVKRNQEQQDRSDADQRNAPLSPGNAEWPGKVRLVNTQKYQRDEFNQQTEPVKDDVKCNQSVEPEGQHAAPGDAAGEDRHPRRARLRAAKSEDGR